MCSPPPTRSYARPSTFNAADDPPTGPHPAIPLEHHLSPLSRARLASPLKGLYKYFNRPGMLMLAGGLPSPAYFPFESLSATTLSPSTFEAEVVKPVKSSWFWPWSTPTIVEKPTKTSTITIPKFEKHVKEGGMTLELSTALQYGVATGLPALGAFILEFTTLVFQPSYTNYQVLVNAGATDAWQKIVLTLCAPGEGVLCEEWTYPSALATAWPSSIRPVALPMDGGGMTPEGLEDVMVNWNEEERGGMKRPHVMYTIPVCQNPTGSTMTAERKKAIYAVCVKWDIIIVEDDPYYFLQAGEYTPPTVRSGSSKTKKSPSTSKTETDEEFLKSLIPSYLKFDYQGRVVRIDTFSKTIAPGSRLGWTTANPVFIERLSRANESSTQSASGFAQVLVAKLLVEEWGMKGWLGWLKGLKAEYRDRRDMLVDLLVTQASAGLDARASLAPASLSDAAPFKATTWELFVPDVKHVGRDEKGFLISEKAMVKGGEKTILSFVAPQGGMFVWLRVHTSHHPSYPAKSTTELIMALWEDIAEGGVLIAPGTMFSAKSFGKVEGTIADEWEGEQDLVEVDGDGFFRLSFSTASEEEMTKAMKIVGKCTKEFWEKRF